LFAATAAIFSVIDFLLTLRVDGKQKYGYPMPCSTMVIILSSYQHFPLLKYSDDISSAFPNIIPGQLNDIQKEVRSYGKAFAEQRKS
jgi:hypothetical protein